MKFLKLFIPYFMLFFVGCHFLTNDSVVFLTPEGKEIKTEIAADLVSQAQGLSRRTVDNFPIDHGMLFYYEEDEIRVFWMNDTYFNLDIFFLDSCYRIVDVERDMPKHPGTLEPPEIARTRPVLARHVFEMRSDSKIAKSLKVGMTIQPKREIRPKR